MKHIGLFGGTFNPIHFGHLRPAQEVLERFALDKIVFIPSALPPHKHTTYLTDAKYRLEMIRLAIQDCPHFEASDVEVQRCGHSYTIDTIRYFTSILSDSKLYFIIGTDAFWDIDSWKSYQELFSLISFIVMSRPGSSDNIDGKALQDYLKKRVSEGYFFSEPESACIHPEKQAVFGTSVSFMDISSTMIRSLISQNKSIRFLMPDSVQKFIELKGLFKT